MNCSILKYRSAEVMSNVDLVTTVLDKISSRKEDIRRFAPVSKTWKNAADGHSVKLKCKHPMQDFKTIIQSFHSNRKFVNLSGCIDSQFQFGIVIYEIYKSKTVTGLDISNNLIEDENQEAYFTEQNDARKNRRSIEVLSELGKALKSNKYITHFEFNNSLDNSRFTYIIASVLKVNKTMKSLSLSDNILFDTAVRSIINLTAVEAFASAIATNNTLTHLDISGSRLADADYVNYFGDDLSLRDRALTILANSLLKNVSLTSLSLEWTMFGYKYEPGYSGCSALIKSFGNGILRKVNIASCFLNVDVNSDVAQLLNTKSSLHELVLRDNSLCGISWDEYNDNDRDDMEFVTDPYLIEHSRYNNSGIKVMADSLGKNKNLLVLSLSRNVIDMEAGLYILNAIKSNRFLKILDLCKNCLGKYFGKYKISDSDVDAFASAIEANSSLTWMNLSDNEFSDAAKTSLTEILRENKMKFMI